MEMAGRAGGTGMDSMEVLPTLTATKLKLKVESAGTGE